MKYFVRSLKYFCALCVLCIVLMGLMLMTGTWNKPGVHNIEEFDPDPFMEALNKWGLPWTEDFHPVLVD